MTKRTKQKRHTATLHDARELRSTRTRNAAGHLSARGALVAKEGVMAYPVTALPPALVTALGDTVPADGMVRVLQTADVLHEPGLDAYQGLPMTTEHPATADRLVPLNDSRFTVGVFFSPTFNRKGVAGDLTIIDAKAGAMVDSGKAVELSLGYRVELEAKSGSFKGKEYQAVKKKIIPNHIAITASGRCGAECVINDCADCGGQSTGGKKVADNVHIAMNDSVVEVAPEAKPIIAKFIDDAGVVAVELDTAKNKIKELETENQKLKDENSDEKRQEEIEAAAEERTEVVTKAAAVLGDSVDLKGKSLADIKKLALEKAGKKVPEGKSESYADALFDSIEVKKARGSDAESMFDSNRNDFDEGKNKKPTTVAEARQRHIEKTRARA